VKFQQSFAWLLLFATLNSVACAQDEDSPVEPLRKFSGTWEKQFTIYRSEWMPEQQAKTGRHSSRMILNDKHMQETGRDSDGSSYLTIYSYDDAGKEYRTSTFRSTGESWQMQGQWDARTNTLTLARQLDKVIRMKATYRFLSPNEFQFSYVAQDDAGKVYFRLEGTGKRVSENGTERPR
jgi:hypothetical protein